MDRTTIGVTTKLYFPKIADRLKLKFSVTPNPKMMATIHGNIMIYLYKYKILGSVICSCKIGDHTTDHLFYYFDLVKQERDYLSAEILRTENWPETKNILIKKKTNF